MMLTWQFSTWLPSLRAFWFVVSFPEHGIQKVLTNIKKQGTERLGACHCSRSVRRTTNDGIWNRCKRGLLAFVSRTTWFAIIGWYASCTLQQGILERRRPPVLFQKITKGLIKEIIKTGATVARKIIQSLQDAGINRN
jgi:hypothetical protein